MHLKYYKLRADPFRLSPDPRFSFPHRTYRKAMAYMRHALLRAEGFIVITGQPGMGKTTLINDLFRGIRPDQFRIARLVSTQLLADDLLRLVAYELDLNVAGKDKASVLNAVGQFLKQQHKEGRRTLLIVDEAQDVPGEALEELRLLTNIQVDGQQLLQIFLVGQEELRELVSTPTLVQLHQRVIAATHIDTLNCTETKEYIKHRLRRVGWEGDPLISNQAFIMIHRFSHGIPRQINQICNRLLLHGSIEERHRLGLQDLKTVIDELYEEMLLPPGVQEIADTVDWFSDSREEIYDEMPFPRAETQTTKAAAPRNNATSTAADRTSPAGTSGNTGHGMAVDNRPDGGTAGNVTVPADAVNNTPPVIHAIPSSAAAHRSRTDRSGRKRSPLRVMAATVLIGVLLIALLIVLLFTIHNETGNRLRDELADLIPPGLREQFRATAMPAPGPATPPERRVNNAPAEPAQQPAVAAHSVTQTVATTDIATEPAEAEAAETATEPVEATGTVTEHAEAADTAMEPAQAADTAMEPAVRSAPLSSLETDLINNGLQVEHLEDDRLKVKLSNAGLFKFNSTEISDASSAKLKKLADVLHKHDEVRIHIIGHTDSIGNPGFNLALSQIRAKGVADYLVSQGLPSDHIRSEGRGDRDTRNEISTQNQPELRRRIEIYLSPVLEE